MKEASVTVRFLVSSTLGASSLFPSVPCPSVHRVLRRGNRGEGNEPRDRGGDEERRLVSDLAAIILFIHPFHPLHPCEPGAALPLRGAHTSGWRGVGKEMSRRRGVEGEGQRTRLEHREERR